MRINAIIHKDAVKYLVLAIIVVNCVFLEIIIVSLLINNFEDFPANFAFLIGLTIFLSLIAVMISPKNWKSEVAFKITESGLIDASTYLSLGHVAWEDVKSIKRVKRFNMDQIRVYLYCPQKYISKKSIFSRCLITLKMLLFKTPITISSSMYRNNIDHTYAVLIDHIQPQRMTYMSYAN